jgi:hypothetical protein
VLTKVADPVDVAHIYPFSMRNLKASPFDPYSIWTALLQFWSQDRIDSWYKAISSGTEVVYNLMCLSPSAYKYHERAYFALEPKEISNDKKCLTVKFFWLPRYQHSLKVDILNPPSIPEDLDGEYHEVSLWNRSAKKLICSGDEICLETNDPERLPLPDSRLLEMQWILHRVTALTGAAEPRDDFGEDTDDDWDIALEDLEAEDEWFAYTPFPEMSLLPPEMSSPPPEMSLSPPEMSLPPPEMSSSPPEMSLPPPEMSSSPPEMSSSPPEKSSPPPEKSSPLTSPPSSLPQCHSFFPSAAKEVEFGTAITTADESIVGKAGEAMDWEAEAKKDTPTGEEKGKRRADIDAVAKFEDGLKQREVLGNRTGYSQRSKGSREWVERDGLNALWG